MTTKLINITDIQEFKPMSINTDVTKKLDFAIIEAQEFDLRPVMGEEFYIDLIEDFNASPSLDKYSDLFNGVKYTYNSRQYEHQGLKSVLCYYAYGRYLANAQTNQTAFGVVQKNNQYSERSDEKTIARLTAQANSGALAYQQRVIDFLNRNSNDYPLWRCTEQYTKPSGGIRINPIGGDNKRKVASTYRCKCCGRYTNCNCDC